MLQQGRNQVLRSFLLAAAVLLLASSPVFSHCDGMDGPVVNAARQALEKRDVNVVLIWVQEKDEAEIRQLFDRTLAVRSLGPQAKDLADRNFFETVVRLHRVAEGASYTGLKPAGRDLGPAIPAADRALENGSVEQLKSLLTEAVAKGLQEQFARALAKNNFRNGDVAAGREYVEAYVEFVHYAERMYEVSTGVTHGHFREPDASPKQPTAHLPMESSSPSE